MSTNHFNLVLVFSWSSTKGDILDLNNVEWTSQ